MRHGIIQSFYTGRSRCSEYVYQYQLKYFIYDVKSTRYESIFTEYKRGQVSETHENFC